MVSHSPSPAGNQSRNAQLIALIAMASFGMLFGTFLLSFLLAQARNAVWPPIGVQPINRVFSYLSTGVILASSLIYMNARRAHLAGNLKATKWSLVAVWSLSWVFLALQYTTLTHMWAMSNGVISPDIYSSFVHLLIGLHAVHLLGGIGGLTYVMVKSFLPQKTVSTTTMQIVGWFWHFLGLLWGLIFLVLVL